MVLFILLLALRSSGQAGRDSITPVRIVGTIHSGNEAFDHKELYKTLYTLKPDIILWEESEPFKKVFGLQTGVFFKVIKVPIEQLAVQKYVKTFPATTVVPFDTLIKNRNSYIRTFVRKRQAMYDLLAAAEKSPKDSEMLTAFEELHQEFFTGIQQLDLATLNTEDVVGMSRAINQLEETLLPALATSYCKDTALLNWFTSDIVFHRQRNDYMVRQVAAIARNNPGKHIVVVVGLDHKYYFQDHLHHIAGLRLIPWPEQP